MDIQAAINRVKQTYEPYRFVSGDCHHLAIALYQSHGFKGDLLAGIRQEINEDGSVFSDTYSHMAYVCPRGIVWDIDGPDADSRWEDFWPGKGVLNEDGLSNRFQWIEIPYDQVQVWLRDHFKQFDPTLTSEIFVLATDPSPAKPIPRRKPC